VRWYIATRTHRAGSQPEHVFHAQILPELLVVLGLRQPRIADLNFRVQITFLRGQQRPAPVNFDAAAFQDKILSVALRVEQALLQQPRGGFGNFGVAPPVLVFRPRIEVKMNDGGFPVRCSVFASGPGGWLPARRDVRCSVFPRYENRPRVPRPPTIRRMYDELQVLQICVSALKIAARQLCLAVAANQDSHDLALGNLPHHLAIHPADGVNLMRPVGFVVRPAQPGGLV